MSLILIIKHDQFWVNTVLHQTLILYFLNIKYEHMLTYLKMLILCVESSCQIKKKKLDRVLGKRFTLPNIKPFLNNIST